MRPSHFLIPILLLAGPAAAFELQSPTDAARLPATTGAIMEAAKVIVPFAAAENPVAGARILSDAEIAALIPSPYSAPGRPGTPGIIEAAKLAIGAAD
jgi:hypothetical protein